MKEGEERNAIINKGKQNQKPEMERNLKKDVGSPGNINDHGSPGLDEGLPGQPSLMQYRSKRRCVVEREKKKKKEWWEEENVLSDEEEFDDMDSDSSDNPRKRQKKSGLMPTGMLPPPNRVFVFSTELANRAAEAVTQGRVASIVAYHRAQPQNQHFLSLHRNNTSDYNMINHSSVSGANPYSYGNYPGHVSKMEGMFPGKAPGGMMEGQGRHGVPSGPVASGFNSIHQYQQYLKQQQQQQQQELRPALSGMDEIQQMLFNPVNGGAKGMFPPPVMPGDEQGGGVRPPFGFTGHVPQGFRQQQMFNQREERFKFPQQQSFTNPTSQQQQQPQPQQQQPQQQQQQQQQPFSTSQPSSQQPPHLPVHSPSSSVSSSSPLSSNIRSPPPYPTSRGAEANTLPGGSSVGAPSPTNASSPHTPHAPLTPRLTTSSLASPKDGQRPPFSPGHVPTSSSFTTQASAQQNIRDSAMKHPLSRQSPSLEKPELSGDKGIPSFAIMSESRPSYTAGNTRQEVAQRPNSLDLPRDNPDSPQLPPPNKSPFLSSSSSPMALHPNPLLESNTTAHHSSKSFSVESLTAPPEKERFYRPPLTGASPYAAYSQQPGLFYAGNKYSSPMLSQGQYQYPAHIQSAPQQFFPSNMPPNMYFPRGSFPIHHTGNREGGV